MTAKPFLPIDDQVRLLGQRGLAVDANTARILMCEGYYSIVNGYKDPFIDKSLSSEVNEDRYRSGASFSDLVLFRWRFGERTSVFLIVPH